MTCYMEIEIMSMPAIIMAATEMGIKSMFVASKAVRGHKTTSVVWLRANSTWLNDFCKRDPFGLDFTIPMLPSMPCAVFENL